MQARILSITVTELSLINNKYPSLSSNGISRHLAHIITYKCCETLFKFENACGYKHCKGTLEYVICEYKGVSYIVVFSRN